MSYQLSKSDILFHQRFLRASGLYKDKLDGLWGKNTEDSDNQFTIESKKIQGIYGTFDVRTENAIKSLVLPAQVLAREFMISAKNAITFGVKILSGNRTYAEQDVIYAQGRTIAGIKVTKARGGESNHNFGIAWDIGIFIDGKYVDKDDRPYIELAHKVMPKFMSLEWGGDWHSIHDNPHYNLKTTSDRIEIIRNRFEKGELYY